LLLSLLKVVFVKLRKFYLVNEMVISLFSIDDLINPKL